MPVPTTHEERIALIRSLFRGREDVFAARWENREKGTSGYGPKRKGGKNGTDIPLSDWWVSAHLRGTEVIGAFAILEDDTCWFLAVDFDEATWKDDVAAFRDTSTSEGLPCAVEVSRSGNGAHAWFFFSAPVPAAVARRMGTYLLTLTTSKRDLLKLKSYDRLFPSQDTVPKKGGYGNLIALPLQGLRVPEGCSVFVDEGFEPYLDQWAFLVSVQRLEPGQVVAMANQAERQGLDLGFLPEIPVDAESLQPWERSPSRPVPPARIEGPLPPVVKAVLAQRLFIEREGLPPALIDRLRRVAAFKNPVFFRNERLRLSNYETPFLICCTEENPRHIGLPRASVDDARTMLLGYGVDLRVEDRRQPGNRADWTFRGSLRPSQAKAVEALAGHDFGVYVAPPGTGKTVVGGAMIAERKCSSLVLVHRKTLLDQWRHQIAMWLDLDPGEVGQIGDGKNKPNGMLDVAMVQSLDKKCGVPDLVAEYGFVIVDECHHVPAFRVERVVAEAKATYVLGLTATPYRQDGHHPILNWHCGPTRFEIKPTDPEGRPPYAQKLICRTTEVPADAIAEGSPIAKVYERLAADSARNRLILDDVIAGVTAGRSPVVLTQRRDHLDVLAAELRELLPDAQVIVMRGAMKAKERRAAKAALAEDDGSARRVLLATGSFLGEGFDDPRLDTLFLALPIAFKGLLVQYAGRIHRIHPDKTEVQVYDYVDDQVGMLRKMFEKRIKGWRSIGYAREEAPLGVAPEIDDGQDDERDRQLHQERLDL